MIAIIDYGAGNIFSVKNALDHLGLESALVSDEKSVKDADAVILPGVGAFPWAMEKLAESGLVDTIKEEAAKKPFLGAAFCAGDEDPAAICFRAADPLRSQSPAASCAP